MTRRAFIDTHLALWLANGDSRLPKKVLTEINSSSETVMSSLSIAELEIKAQIGKMPLPQDFVNRFEQQGIRIEPFDTRAALQLQRFPSLIHHDPFDRMILAQASMRVDTRFFTFDQVLNQLGLDWIVDCS